MSIVIIVTECLDAKEYRNAKKSNVNILLGQDTVIGPQTSCFVAPNMSI